MADVITLNEIEEIKSLLQTKCVNTDANVTTLLERIGTTAQTGGTTTSGTVMAKLNTLLAANTNHGSVSYSTAGTYTWTCPAGVSQVFVLATGGSGGGGGGGGGYVYFYSGYDEATPGGGGGSGGISAIVYTILPVTAGSAYSLVVGAAGTAGSAGANMIRNNNSSIATNVTAGTAGGAGGATKFGNLLTVNGGGGGGGGAAGGEYGGSGTASAAGGKVGSLSTNKVFLVKEISGVSGNTGGKGTVSSGYEGGETVHYYNIGTGGSSTVGKIINSGKGGNGGRAVSSSIVNPTAGSKGSAGVIHVIW